MNLKILIFTSIHIMIAGELSGQIVDSNSVVYNSINHEVDSIGNYLTADKMPEFKGGNVAVYSFVQENISSRYLNRSEKSRSYVSFIIEKNGCIRDIQVVKGKDKRLNKSIVKALKRMPNWKSGEIDDKKVDVKLTFNFNY
ncbi:energy transducer TonB [Cyclobacterium sediminis]